MSGSDVIDILLIEDNSSDVELTLRALAEVSRGRKVHVIRDGAEALHFFFRRGKYADRTPGQHVKLVLLDLKLPKVSGLDVLKAIRSEESLRAIPVVVFTSSREASDVRTAYQYGVNSYVVKPVEAEQFVQVVAQTGSYWLLVNEPPL
jgi:two-component system response regulator